MEMTLKYDLVTTATVDAATVKKVLTKSLEDAMGRKIKNLEFTISSQMRGYGLNEHYETEFSGVKITFEKEFQ